MKYPPCYPSAALKENFPACYYIFLDFLVKKTLIYLFKYYSGKVIENIKKGWGS